MPLSPRCPRSLRLAALLVPLSLLPLACDPSQPPPSPPGPPPVGEDPDAVYGQRVIHRRLDTGDVVASDNTGVRSTLSVLVPTGDTFETRPLVARDAGNFQFDEVPQGPYYLKRGTGSYVITEHRQLNLDEYLLGREGVVTVPGVIPLTLSVDGLAPMDAYQDFGLVAPNAGAAGVIRMSSTPQPGGTALSGQAAEYRSAFGRQEIIDSTKGDRLYVLQKLRRASGGFNYFAAARAMTLTNATFRSDEQSTPVSGTFSEFPPRQLTVDWRRSSFEAHRAAVHPLAVALPETSVRHSLLVTPAVGGLAEGVVGYAGELISGNLPASTQDVTLALEYANPYPPAWGVVASVVHRYYVPVRLPSQGPSGTLDVSLKEQAEVSAFTSGPVQARLSPPTQLQVDGANAQEERALTSLTPVFTWEPPALGTADVYELRIFRLYASPQSPEVASTETVGTFLTAQRRVRVPPGVLEPKQAYVARIAAMRTPGRDLTQAPYRVYSLVDTSLAESLTSVLTTP
jgi:hypothetical protein